MKKLITSVWVVGAAIVLGGCMGTQNTALSSCYELVEDPTTQIVITPKGKEFASPSGSNTTYDTITLIDATGEQETLGEIREGSFYYADGSGWKMSEENAVGFGGLIEGLEAKKVACP